MKRDQSSTSSRLPAAAVALALDRLEQLGALSKIDMDRLRRLAGNLSAADSSHDVDAALPVLFGADKTFDQANVSLRQMVKRIRETQDDAIADENNAMVEADRLTLHVERRSGELPRRLWFSGRLSAPVEARVNDYNGVVEKNALYENQTLMPELLGLAEEGRRPILLFTVNDREANALREVFLGEKEPLRFTRDDYPYELLGYANDGKRPVIAFRCRMGSVRSGAAGDRVREAIEHHKPSAIIAVGIAFGKKGKKQALGDVLLAEAVMSYESERLGKDGTHLWRGDRMPASQRWLERASTVSITHIRRHKGLLLCGEKLVDNKDFRALLADEFPESIGGDMESAGLLAACHNKRIDWLVVKGVSDWGDGSKKSGADAEQDALQYQAAYHAAEVVFSAIHLKPPAPGKRTVPAAPSACHEVEPRTQDYHEVRSALYENPVGQFSMKSTLSGYGRPAEQNPPTSDETAQHALMDWLRRDDAPPVFAMLGEYGTGKTINCQRFYRDLRVLRSAKDAPAWARDPLYFDLRQLSLFKGQDRHGVVELPDAKALIEDLISHGWIIPPGQPTPDFAHVQSLVNQGALLILDGLDECLVHLIEAQHPQFVQTLLNLIADARPAHGVPQPRLLVSCRNNFFKTFADQRNLFTGQHRGKMDSAWYEARELLPLSEAQIDAYLRAAVPELSIETVRELIAHTHNLTELARRPMTLKLIARHIGELETLRLRGETVNGAVLYGLVAKEWLERDEGKHHLQPEHKLRLMPALAAHLWRNGVRALPYEELHRWFHTWRAAQPDLAERYSPAIYNQSKLEEDLRTATFVVRQQEDSEQIEGFRFAHSSLAEYFLARYLADAVAQDRPEDWAMAIPSEETLDFLAGLLLLEQSRLDKLGVRGQLVNTLSRWRMEYRRQASELLLRYALRALEGSGDGQALGPPLAGFRLAGASLRGWHFGAARSPGSPKALLAMQGCDFHGADLREARFEEVRLDRADFGGARLDRASLQYSSLRAARFGAASLVAAVFRHCTLADSQWLPSGERYHAVWAACSETASLPAELAGDGLFQATATPATRPLLPFEPATTRAARLRLATLRGHDDPVNSVAWSADGGRLASASGDGTLRVWDAASGECLATLRGHDDRVSSVAWSADGGRLASGSHDGTLRVWDAASGECLATLRGHDGWVNSVAWSADGGRLASGSGDGTLRAWDAASGECLATLRGHDGWVNCVAWSADGGRLASGSGDGTLRVWDAASGECLATLRGHAGWVNSVAWSADGGRLASGSHDGTLRVWDAASGECLATLRGHAGWVNSVAWSADGGRMASGSGDGTLRVWDAASGECLATLRGHDDRVSSVAWSADGGRLASGSHDGTLRVWDAASGECLATLRGHDDRVSSVAWSADGGRLASGSHDGTLRVWDAASGECLATLRGHDGWVRSVAWSADGGRLASGSGDGTLRVWDAASGECLATLRGHDDRVSSVAWSADGGRLASASGDGTLRVWDAASGECLATLRGHDGWVNSVAWSADGGRLASGSDDGTLRVWDAASGECLATLRGHDVWVRSVAWSADGGRLASGSGDGTLRVWDAASGECLATLRGHDGWVNSVAWSADGGRLASGSGDGTLRVWDAASGECLATLRGHDDPVSSVAWSADGGRLASASGDGTLRVWDAASGECLRCHWANSQGEVTGVAVWRPAREDDPQDAGELLAASGDAWRLLGWQVLGEPLGPGAWRRLPVVY